MDRIGLGQHLIQIGFGLDRSISVNWVNSSQFESGEIGSNRIQITSGQIGFMQFWTIFCFLELFSLLFKLFFLIVILFYRFSTNKKKWKYYKIKIKFKWIKIKINTKSKLKKIKLTQNSNLIVSIQSTMYKR